MCESERAIWQKRSCEKGRKGERERVRGRECVCEKGREGERERTCVCVTKESCHVRMSHVTHKRVTSHIIE